MSKGPLIVALDHPSAAQAIGLADRLDPQACRVKVANTLFVRSGPDLVEDLVGRGFEVFLDLKFHDIPVQVAGACRAAADLGVWMLNVHASGGLAMMRAAARALDGGAERPLLIAVTALTSLDGADLDAVGILGPPAVAVARLARLANDAGLDGIVCSPQELVAVRKILPRPFVTVTPGIRPQGAAGDDDQKRVTTPGAALASGADYLVVGRPITEAPEPMEVVERLNAELRGSA